MAAPTSITTSQIVGADGKPLQQEIASVERDIHRTFFGRALRNEDDTLLQRGGSKGLKIYDELKRDAHAGAVLAKRKLAVTGRPWSVKPASDRSVDKKAAELVQAAFEHLRFNHVCKRLLEATLKGFAVSEVMWEVRDGLVLPATLIARDQRRFVFDLDGQLRLRTRANMIEGELLPDRKFVVHRRGADDDSPYGTGIGGMLFWPVFFKRNGITFWLTFADKFGSPTAVGKYPNGTETAEQTKLLDALRSISQDAGIIVPEGMLIEFVEATKSNTDTYEKLARYMDEQMSKAVLGETMSTTAASAGLGSSQADVQNDVRLEVAVDDANELDETLNDSLVRWIVEYNMPGAGLPMVERDFGMPEDLKQRADRDKVLFDMGWQLTEQAVTEVYGDSYERKPEPEPPALVNGAVGPDGLPLGNTADDPADDGKGQQFAEGKPLQQAARAFNAGRQQALIDGADALAEQWRTVMKKPVEDMLSVLDETGDLVLFRERMSKLLDAEPDPAVADTIARATFASHVLGRGVSRAASPASWFTQALKKALAK